MQLIPAIPVPSTPVTSGSKPPLLRTPINSGRMRPVDERKENTNKNDASLPTPHLQAPQAHPVVLTRPVSLISVTSSASISPVPQTTSTGIGTSTSSLESSEEDQQTRCNATMAHPTQAFSQIQTHRTGSFENFPQPRNTVHILWSMSDVPLLTSHPTTYAVDRVQRIADSYGSISTFRVFNLNDQMNPNAGLTLAMKRVMQDHGIEIEEVYSHGQGESSAVQFAIMNSLIRIGMIETEAQVLQQIYGRGNSTSTILFLSGQEELSRPLSQLRRSNRFNVVLIYHQRTTASGSGLLAHPATLEPVSLIRLSTVWFEWSQLLRHGLSPQIALTFDQPQHQIHSRSSSYKDLPYLSHSRASSHTNLSSMPSSAGSSAYTSRATTPSSVRSASSNSVSALLQNTFNFSSGMNSRSNSFSSLPSIDPHPPTSSGGRSSMGATLDVAPSIDSDTTNIAELSVELRLERLPAKVRSMVMAMKAVLAYCEQEKIIPRESVLKKRLLDTSIGIGSQMADVDFEQLLELSVQCGVAAVEGKAPQRIIYPANHSVDGTVSSGVVRKFDCADFFQPTQRLTVDDTYELLAFLNRERPEVERGRFGFAQWLETRAPAKIKKLPHGVLVELVQLLLNQKILLFRKGRVSTSPNLPFADLHALAALSVASKPHTALLSTTKGPQGQQAAMQLKILYTQLKTDIDAHNAGKGLAPLPSYATGGIKQGGTCLDAIASSLSRDLPRQHSAPARPWSAPNSPNGWSTSGSGTSVGSQPFSNGLDALAIPPSSSAWLHGGSNSHLRVDDSSSHLPSVGEFDTAELDTSLRFIDATSAIDTPSSLEPTTPIQLPSIHTPHSTAPYSRRSSIVTPRWKPAKLYVKTTEVTFVQILARKLAQAHRYPVSEASSSVKSCGPVDLLFHFDLSGSSVDGRDHRWSANCSFSVGLELHSFGGSFVHDQLPKSMESLAEYILQQPVMWKIAGQCVLQEIRERRRIMSGTKRLPFLARDEPSIAEAEANELTIRTRIQTILEQRLSHHPLLHLDSVLSLLRQPPMIFSCELVPLRSDSGARQVWSVAAALPQGLTLPDPNMSEEAFKNAYSATSLHEEKKEAKIECARQLLSKIRASHITSTAALSHSIPRPTMNPKAPVWTPPAESTSASSQTETNTSSVIPPTTESGRSNLHSGDRNEAIISPLSDSSGKFTQQLDPSPANQERDHESEGSTDEEESQYLNDWNSFEQQQNNNNNNHG